MRPDRLKEIRLSMRLTQGGLAEMVGVQQLQIGRWEKGENKPNSDQLIKLAEALSTSADYLLGLSNDASSHIGIDKLTAEERMVITALRQGKRMEAVKIISGG